MQLGISLALTSAVLFGASTPFAKLLLGSVDPWLMAGLLYLGAGLGLAVVHVSRGILRLPTIEAPLRRPDMPWLAAVILFGGVLGPLLLMFGLARTDAAAASLLLNLEGLATMGIAWVVFRENVDRRLLLGAFAILAGAAIISWQGEASFQWSGLLIASACLCWGIDNNLTRKLSSADPVQIAMLKGLVAGTANLTLALWRGAALPSAVTVVATGVVGFLGYGVSLALFVLGLRYLGTARPGAYFSLAPFVGAVLAVVMLGEPLSVQLLVAGGLMGFGLWLHLAERHDHEHLHEPMEHEHPHRHDEHHQHEHSLSDPSGEPHTHWHRHVRLVHRHPHYPDLHHRHGHPYASFRAQALMSCCRLENGGEERRRPAGGFLQRQASPPRSHTGPSGGCLVWLGWRRCAKRCGRPVGRPPTRRSGRQFDYSDLDHWMAPMDQAIRHARRALSALAPSTQTDADLSNEPLDARLPAPSLDIPVDRDHQSEQSAPVSG